MIFRSGFFRGIGTWQVSLDAELALLEGQVNRLDALLTLRFVHKGDHGRVSELLLCSNFLVESYGQSFLSV
jgi:hypothetical protein